MSEIPERARGAGAAIVSSHQRAPRVGSFVSIFTFCLVLRSWLKNIPARNAARTRTRARCVCVRAVAKKGKRSEEEQRDQCDSRKKAFTKGGKKRRARDGGGGGGSAQVGYVTAHRRQRHTGKNEARQKVVCVGGMVVLRCVWGGGGGGGGCAHAHVRALVSMCFCVRDCVGGGACVCVQVCSMLVR